MNKDNNIKRILCWSLLLVLSASLIQHRLGIIESGRLFGAMKQTPDIRFTIKGWWDGSYQEQKSSFLNDSFGFRPDYVRLTCQLDYWLFNKFHANGAVLGRDRYLMDQMYIDIHCGNVYIPDSVTRSRLVKLKRIQDTLDRLGVDMVFVFAPSKPKVLPEKILARKPCRSDGKTIFNDYRHITDSLGIHAIDFNSWFLSLKPTLGYPLFTKQGIHWSVYGAALAADSFINYCKNLNHFYIPDLEVRNVWTTNVLDKRDLDLVEVLNLIFPFTEETAAYADLHYTEDSSARKPKIIFLGDSFVWSFIYSYVPHHVSKDWEFWEYFRTVWDRDAVDGKRGPKSIRDHDWVASLRTADCFVLLFTELNLPEGGFGFIEEAYAHFYGKAQ